MADVIRKSTNRFTKGLIMDFSPENTKNEVLTHALNATLLTFNGNELSLQNDMGNARVETAYLPEGYMPVGTCEYGGIIYIVSYNPLEDKSQIGCFPSPERNVSNKELGISDAWLDKSKFQEIHQDNITGNLLNNTQYVLLKNDNINPGDKFLVCSNDSIYEEALSDLFVNTVNDEYQPVSNPILSLNIVSIEDSGKIVYLNSDIRKYTESHGDSSYKYHILGKMSEENQTTIDPDEYRNTLSSGYSVFKSKTSGKLAILAELIMIDSYSVTHSLRPSKDSDDNIIDGKFDIIIHTDVSPQITEENKNIVPKLKYYFLQNSLGYLQTSSSDNTINKCLYKIDEEKSEAKLNNDFFDTKLSDIYVATTNEELDLDVSLKESGEFDFPEPYTYHGKTFITSDPSESEELQTKFIKNKYHRIIKLQVDSNYEYFYSSIMARFYKYNPNSQSYTPVGTSEFNENYTYYLLKNNFIYYDAERKEENKGKPLYKLPEKMDEASLEIKKDTTIDKYEYAETTIYKLATEQEIQVGNDLYIKNSDNEWESTVDNSRTDVTYYKRIIHEGYKLVGKDVSSFINKTLYYLTESNNYLPATPEEVQEYWNKEIFQPTDSASDCWGYKFLMFYRVENPQYINIPYTDITKYEEKRDFLYYKSLYTEITQWDVISDTETIFIKVPTDKIVSYDKFKPSNDFNYIQGNPEPSDLKEQETSIIVINTGDYTSNGSIDNYLDYSDVKLGSIKLPKVVSDNGLDLPFKYDYTLVPCMSYGKLKHLAVSNTVDFSKLHAFNQSKFTTWKYHIDGNQLRLTFGTDIYDMYENDKVDGLVLEFYDLWGFAGSLEISDKKSYSGIFTKLIPLNVLGALSKNRISTNGYVNTYKRNINIVEDSDNFKLNGKSVKYKDYDTGWVYSESDSFPEEDNDCGTLYSNILYGVKAYLRRTKQKGTNDEVKEYIKKDEFFLYTLPIYNDFYYSVNNFNNLTNPQLDLILTYKLEDKSNKIVYTDDNIVDGYDEIDSTNVSDYINGFYDKNDLDVVKYYKYSGLTNLYLEVGLKKEYEDFKISYSPSINSKFKCNLLLVGEDKSFTINSNEESKLSPEQLLNYNNNIDYNINTLEFEEGDSDKYSLSLDNIYKHNFINIENRETSPIKIKYEYIVGYKVAINDIRDTEIPATTICALCHKDADGIYNYSDFGIYEQNDNGNPIYLSEAMFYNGGTAEQEIFGLCRQMKTTGNMVDLCQTYATIPSEAQNILEISKLNNGEPLKQLSSKIGKLTFCQPHAHGMSSDTGVNIYNDGGGFGISPHYDFGEVNDSGKNDISWGTIPTSALYNYPRYNMSLNTKDMLEYYGEFLSTIDYAKITGPVYGYAVKEKNGEIKEQYLGEKTGIKMREYTGFTGQQIADFNKKLIETMKGVYAYNPDYDSLKVQVGKVSVADKKIQFISNLISKNSSINFDAGETFNDYIYIGNILFSKYLTFMHLYSESYDNKQINITKDNNSEILDQIKLTPRLEYCGTSTNPYLITTLTYNTDAPYEIEDQLMFKSSNTVVLKKSDGTTNFLEGIPNKRVLYGYNEKLKKLVLLDVSNYLINLDGKLALKSNLLLGEDIQSIQLNNKSEGKGYISYEIPVTCKFGEESELVIVNITCNLSYVYQPTMYKDNAIIGFKDNNNSYIKIDVKANINSNSNYSYEVDINDVTFLSEGKVLNDKVDRDLLISLEFDTLNDLISDANNTIVMPKPGYGPLTGHSSDFWVSSNASDHLIIKDDNSLQLNLKLQGIPIYKITFNSINLTITKHTQMKNIESSIVHTGYTSKYFERSDKKYSVLKDFKMARIRGSSITLNDLVYEGVKDKHRLFIKRGCCTSIDDPRSLIFYRSLEDKSLWNASLYQHKNRLYLLTGPCFTKDNLYE